MIVISVMAFLIHAFIVAKAVSFFRTGGACRESDKTMVATAAGLSALFIVAQAVVWSEQPWRFIHNTVGGPMFMAYNFAVAAYFLAQIKILTDRRERTCPAP